MVFGNLVLDGGSDRFSGQRLGQNHVSFGSSVEGLNQGHGIKLSQILSKESGCKLSRFLDTRHKDTENRKITFGRPPLGRQVEKGLFPFPSAKLSEGDRGGFAGGGRRFRINQDGQKVLFGSLELPGSQIGDGKSRDLVVLMAGELAKRPDSLAKGELSFPSDLNQSIEQGDPHFRRLLFLGQEIDDHSGLADVRIGDEPLDDPVGFGKGGGFFPDVFIQALFKPDPGGFFGKSPMGGLSKGKVSLLEGGSPEFLQCGHRLGQSQINELVSRVIKRPEGRGKGFRAWDVPGRQNGFHACPGKGVG